MLGKVLMWCIGIEALGALAMYMSWGESLTGLSNGKAWFYAVFHSVSAFNNAGISLFTEGLSNPAVAHNYSIHCIITALVFFGALGMVAIFDMFGFERLRERMEQPWKHISFATKIALYFSLGLVGIGSISYWLLERVGKLAVSYTHLTLPTILLV